MVEIFLKSPNVVYTNVDLKKRYMINDTQNCIGALVDLLQTQINISFSFEITADISPKTQQSFISDIFALKSLRKSNFSM